jgi:hypothetical protein
MEAVKLIRLKNGEDIIAYTEQIDKMNFILREPMVVLVKFDNRTSKQTVIMDHWLPKSIIRHNEAFITKSEILTIMEPTSEFSEYFENAIMAINKTISDSENPEATKENTDQHIINMMLDTVGPDISIVH